MRASIILLIVFHSIFSLADVSNDYTTEPKSDILFTRAQVGERNEEYITIKNTSEQNQHYEIADDCSRDFYFRNYCLSEVKPGEDCEIQIEYSPEQKDRGMCSILIDDSNHKRKKLNIHYYAQ